MKNGYLVYTMIIYSQDLGGGGEMMAQQLKVLPVLPEDLFGSRADMRRLIVAWSSSYRESNTFWPL